MRVLDIYLHKSKKGHARWFLGTRIFKFHDAEINLYVLFIPFGVITSRFACAHRKMREQCSK